MKEKIQKLFNDFLKDYDVEKHRLVWEKQSKEFRDFWQNKILNKNYSIIPEADLDPIIRVLDYLARGSREFREAGGEAVAKPWIFQGAWYRMFNSLKENEDIRQTLDRVFKATDDESKIGLIDKLHEVNEGKGNGLTGEKGVILNDLLFAYNPNQYICVVSLECRFQIIDYFGLGSSESYQSSSYGEKIIQTNKDIISGFKEKYGIDTISRALTQFFYSAKVEPLWKEVISKELIVEADESDQEEVLDEKGFALEKHLEDFLIANWEKTELGKNLKLIEEEGIPVSQQYNTLIGRIDILVQDKTTNDYVVIELKKGRTSDKVVGQISTYIGWVQEHKAKDGRNVRGIIISGENDEKLRYSLKNIPNVEMFIYKVDFSLKKII